MEHGGRRAIQNNIQILGNGNIPSCEELQTVLQKWTILYIYVKNGLRSSSFELTKWTKSNLNSCV